MTPTDGDALRTLRAAALIACLSLAALSALPQPVVAPRPPAPPTLCDRLSGMPPEQQIVSPDSGGIRLHDGGSAAELDPIIAACRAAEAADPEEPRFPFRLGLALAEKRDAAAAAEAFRRGIALGSIGAADELASALRWTGTTEGSQRAIAGYEAALRSSDDPELRRGLAGSLLAAPGALADRPRALTLLNQLTTEGYGPAVTDLGRLYRDGTAVAADPARALALFEAATAGGSREGADQLGQLLRDGPDDIADPVKARAAFALAADRGSADALNRLAQMIEAGEGGPVDADQAFELYARAASLGFAAAMTTIGVHYDGGDGRPVNHTLARRWYVRALARGDGCAASWIGMQYDHGRGVPEDAAEALRWFQKGATAGCGTAINNLGWAYQEGRGVARDRTRAIAYYEDAIGRGDLDAMNNLGTLYLGDRYARDDLARGIGLLRRAGERGNARALNNLGDAYRRGIGVIRNDAQARTLFERALALHSPEAAINLGGMMQNGTGGPRDLLRAKQLFQSAAQAGIPLAMSHYAGRLAADGCDAADVAGDADACDAIARQWLERAVAAGDQHGLPLLAGMAADGRGGPADPVEADRLFRKALAVQPALGLAYASRLRRGEGVLADPAAALSLLASLDSVEAKVMRAAMLRAGEAGPRDPRLAGALLIEAARARSVEGSRDLAALLRRGDKGVAADPVQARELLRRNVGWGDEPSRLVLADMLLQGEGGPADPAAARALLLEGQADALLHAAEMLTDGVGGPRDPLAAEAALQIVVTLYADPRGCLGLAWLEIAPLQDDAAQAEAAAEHLLCALAAGDPAGRDVLASATALPEAVKLALGRQARALAGEAAQSGPGDDGTFQLLEALQRAGSADAALADAMAAWRTPIADATDSPDVGQRMAVRLRQAWVGRVRDAHLKMAKQPDDLR